MTVFYLRRWTPWFHWRQHYVTSDTYVHVLWLLLFICKVAHRKSHSWSPVRVFTEDFIPLRPRCCSGYWLTSCRLCTLVIWQCWLCLTFQHRRSQDFLWGCTFLAKKVDDLFLVVALKDCLNLPQNLSHVAKTVLIIDLLQLGVHFVSWGCTYTFFLQVRPENFFTALGGAGAPTAPPG